jgi:hypothetical protein
MIKYINDLMIQEDIIIDLERSSSDSLSAEICDLTSLHDDEPEPLPKVTFGVSVS